LSINDDKKQLIVLNVIAAPPDEAVTHRGGRGFSGFSILLRSL
jgi:hypothetical protein